MVLAITTLARRVSITAIALVSALNPVVAAPVSAATTIPMRAMLRTCDFTPISSPSSASYGAASAVVRAGGGTAAADVHISEPGTPGAHFDVALIQMPHASSVPCTTPGPGVAVSTIELDGVGQGSTTVQSGLQSGATGVWVFIQRPSPYSQSPVEFYTSDFVAPV